MQQKCTYYCGQTNVCINFWLRASEQPGIYITDGFHWKDDYYLTF